MTLPVNTGAKPRLGSTRIVPADQSEHAEHQVDKYLDRVISEYQGAVIPSTRQTIVTPQSDGFIAVTASIEIDPDVDVAD